jgi:amino acid transporter
MLTSVSRYGEAEFVFSIIKVAAVVGFILLGVFINTGVAGNGPALGTKFW